MGRTSTSSDSKPTTATPAAGCDRPAVIVADTVLAALASVADRLEALEREHDRLIERDRDADLYGDALVDLARGAGLRGSTPLRAADELRDALRMFDTTRAWALAALERCRALEAQRDSERRHADELVARLNAVTYALGPHRTAGRTLAEDVRRLIGGEP